MQFWGQGLVVIVKVLKTILECRAEQLIAFAILSWYDNMRFANRKGCNMGANQVGLYLYLLYL